jgi:hypothetical protein
LGVEKEFEKVKLFAGFIYRETGLYRQVISQLQNIFSPVDSESETFDFDFTTYYNREMGTPLYKKFVSFKELIEPVRLPEIKILTNKIENETMASGGRIINIDPGYLSSANVILATTKNHYHRVPLQQGIYAHIEYVIKKKNTLTPLEWTYPDFRTTRYMDFFKELILLYKKNLKAIYPWRDNIYEK